MNIATTEFSIVPVRKDPSHRIEMTTQILFGEKLRIIDKIKEWVLIELLFDSSGGWVEKSSIRELNNEEQRTLDKDEPYILPGVATAKINTLLEPSEITLMPGSEICGLTDKKDSFIFLGEVEYVE